MRIAKVFGTVTLNRQHESLRHASLRLATPLTRKELETGQTPQGETLVVYDELGAGDNSLAAIAEGPEAAQPFRPAVKPIDAYVAAILDHIDIRSSAKQQPHH